MRCNIVVQNNAGIRCVIGAEAQAFGLGAVFVRGQLLEVPLTKGFLCLRHMRSGEELWFPATRIAEQSSQRVVVSGEGQVEGTGLNFTVTLEAPSDAMALRLIYEFSVDRDLSAYEACLQYHTDYAEQWRAHLYPWAEDAAWVERERLDNMGIPSVFLYREDRALGLLWGIDPNSDYLNPTTWTRDFGLYFIDGVQPAQFRVGGGLLRKDIQYRCPMQIVATDQSDPDAMIKDLMENWIRLNHYEVQPLQVRSNDEALRIFIEGRRDSTEAWIPGKGYSLHGARHTFLYFGVQAMGAYFDCLLYEMTGDPLWRERAFEQMDFIAEGQIRDRNDFNYGAIHTTYQLEPLKSYGRHGPGFNSDDRYNVGLKPDICALLVRYMLVVWQRVKDHEGIDRQDWYETATLAAEWIARQRNNDGGLPQKVQAKPLEMRWTDDQGRLVVQPYKSRSSTSGRALPSLLRIYRITGDPKYRRLLSSMEDYTLRCVQNQYYFTGHHPDLPPYELEEASIWGAAEYWLDRYDETGYHSFLRHAEANAYLALSWWCPRDLSWVSNPTQGGCAEQQHFLQYSVYNYQNRKVESLWRLYQRTGNPLFRRLFERTLQNIYFTQETEGGNKGGTYERIADPWLARKGHQGTAHFDSLGVNYTNEQALDCFVQVLELARMGRRLYEGKCLTTKVYPDGACYYSHDISQMMEVPLEVLPSAGTIRVTVSSWRPEKKAWSVVTSQGGAVTLRHRISELDPDVWYDIRATEEKVGSYQSNPFGELEFAYSGCLEEGITLEMADKSGR